MNVKLSLFNNKNDLNKRIVNNYNKRNKFLSVLFAMTRNF